MEEAMWRRKIGDQAYDYLRGRTFPAVGPAALAGLLDALVEVGFQAPERAPVLDPAGTKTLWPGPQGGAIAVVTPKGLLQAYTGRGHGIMAFRLEQLMYGCGQLLLPRLQEVCAAYEQQCTVDQVQVAPVDHVVFVGGSGREDLTKLADLATQPQPVERASRRG